ncbi:MAG: hypothetical protein ACYDH6_10530 [Acidimicrobiales bacterium]
MARSKDTDELHRRDRVVSVLPIKEIPEGTHGQIKMVVGQTWVRYLVEWETGEWTGTVDSSKIVRADRLELYRDRQAAAEAERKASAPAAALASGGSGDTGDAGGAGGDSRIPEHLLERSRQARARSETKAS